MFCRISYSYYHKTVWKKMYLFVSIHQLVLWWNSDSDSLHHFPTENQLRFGLLSLMIRLFCVFGFAPDLNLFYRWSGMIFSSANSYYWKLSFVNDHLWECLSRQKKWNNVFRSHGRFAFPSPLTTFFWYPIYPWHFLHCPKCEGLRDFSKKAENKRVSYSLIEKVETTGEKGVKAW